MQSKSEHFPQGMGNASGELGHNIMDHHFQVGAYGEFDGFKDKYYTEGARMGSTSHVSETLGVIPTGKTFYVDMVIKVGEVEDLGQRM